MLVFHLDEFPICKYQTEWNISEKFNEKLIEALGEHASELNAEPDRYREIYLQVYKTVDQENKGLREQGEKLQEWIYKQLEE